MRLRLLIIISMNLLLTACTTVGFYFANANVAYENMHIQKDVAYGDKPYETLDVYAPTTNDKHRILIFFYGGGWSEGRKENYAFVADRFVKEGYTVIIPNYGKYPQVTYPVFVQESAHAVAWADKHFHYPSLFVMGHSAGAYNAAMMATDPQYLAAYGLTQARINGVIGLAGPYEFTPDDKKYQEVFNHMPDYKKMHVSTFVTGNQPPMLLLHGEDDDTVLPKNAALLADAVRKAGGSATVITYPDVEHIKIVGALTSRWEHYAPVARDISAFMEAHSK